MFEPTAHDILFDAFTFYLRKLYFKILATTVNLYYVYYWFQVLSARKVQLVLGYFVRCIRRVGEFEASVKQPESRAIPNIAADKNSDKYILELQPAIKGLESQIFEADLVLWTVGSKPLLPHVEPPNNRFHDRSWSCYNREKTTSYIWRRWPRAIKTCLRSYFCSRKPTVWHHSKSLKNFGMFVCPPVEE